MKEKTEPQTFVYATYIRTTPEKLWEALTNAEFSELYWFGFRIESEWKVGVPLRVRAPKKLDLDVPEDCIQDIVGEVLAYDPPRRLVYTFGGNDKPEVAVKRNGPSRVTYELKSTGPMVRLRLIHENLIVEDMESDPNKWQGVNKGVNNGWPAILSSLKSLLETGKAITFSA